MTHKNYAGAEIAVDNEGYLIDPEQWTTAIAEEIAQEEGLLLTEKHIDIIIYLRQLYYNGEKLTIRSINPSGIVNLKEFYSLFPGAPLKTASRIGGLPNPKSCV